jgi:hypothetical protein
MSCIEIYKTQTIKAVGINGRERKVSGDALFAAKANK